MSANADPQAPQVVLLGVDWGTSNLRVHQIDANGAIIDSRHSAHGILNVPDNGFAQVLEDQAGDWLRELPAVPVVACGMVGARQGWVEVPYVQCPVSVTDLARALCPVDLGDGRHMHLVSGAAWRGDVDLVDVIRGEESTIVGALRGTLDEGLVCLPGTHTKWAWVADGALQRFRTAMSGEVYQVLLEHSILGRMVIHDAAFDGDAFARGVLRAASTGGLLHHLFSVRALRLFDELSEQQAPSYLSGLLTATDVLSMRSSNEFNGALMLVGAGATGNAYAQAFTTLGIPYTLLDSDTAVARGLHAISGAAGLI
ncbi:MAG: 2-dehydro-3-deoxygalactonokinase [Gammaproteobacteria bacterium]|jgi:2-dehydro-3-deoxygalactonokinase